MILPAMVFVALIKQRYFRVYRGILMIGTQRHCPIYNPVSFGLIKFSFISKYPYLLLCMIIAQIFAEGKRILTLYIKKHYLGIKPK